MCEAAKKEVKDKNEDHGSVQSLLPMVHGKLVAGIARMPHLPLEII